MKLSQRRRDMTDKVNMKGRHSDGKLETTN